MTSTELKDKMVSLLEDKKALDVSVLEIASKSSVADYFVLATGTSKTQIKSLADYVEETLEQEGIKPTHNDGREGGLWLVLDYDNVILHVFEQETRERYDLEKLWK